MRDIESQAITDLLTRIEVGPSALIVEGEAGIGKTTLVLDTVDRAVGNGFHLLSARGSQAEVSYAYAALADLLSGVGDLAPDPLPDGARAVLDRATSGIAAAGSPAIDERVVAKAFLTLLEHLARQSPVLVIIDDSQWLDTSSRAVIGYAARRLNGPVGMLLTLRTGEPVSRDGLSWLDLPRPDMITRVRMRPLSLGAVHGLIADRLGRTLPRPTIIRLYEISCGNPLFALELAAQAIAEGPQIDARLPATLAELVRRRIGAVPADVGEVLLAAASASAPTVELLSATTDNSPARVVELLESLERPGVIDVDGNSVRFAHPLFASGVYGDATAARRRSAHRKLAAAVDRPEEKARHLALAAATGDADTLAALDAATEATSAQGAPAVAAELMELALKFDGQNVYRRIRAGELHFRAGSLAAARQRLDEALTEAPPGLLRSMALMWLGAVKGYDDDTAGAAEAMADAVEEAGDVAPLRLLCLLRLCLVLVMTDRLADAITRAEAAVQLAEQLGIADLRSQALSIWVVGTFVHGRGVDHAALQTALELEEPNGGATTFFRASAAAAMISAYTGDLDRARDQMLALQEHVLDGGTEVDILWAVVHVVAIAVWRGRYAEAAEAAHDAVQRAEQMAGRLALTTAWTQVSAAAAYRGQQAEARAAATSAIETGYAIGAPQLAKEPAAYLAFLEVSLGNYSAALDTLGPLLDGFHPVHGVEIEGGRYLPDAIEALTAVGRADEAQPLAEALEQGGSTRDRPWMLAMGARGQAHVLAARGELDAAARAAKSALTHHQRLPMPFETARTQLLLGQIQRRQRQRQTAQTTLSSALATFETLGTPLWAQRARTELARLSAPTAGAELTPAEERVARRAAAGLSNREIAAELFVAPKTVEMNLSSIYRKLAIRSRAQLHARLAGSENSRENPGSSSR